MLNVRRTKAKRTVARYRLQGKCTVCGGNAHGYNFDVLTCESCKAFFRRNALRPVEKLLCSGFGHCDVNFNQRKRCKRCRLDRCIEAGMRKDYILSERQKEEKRKKVEKNRRFRQDNLRIQQQNSRRTVQSLRLQYKLYSQMFPSLHKTDQNAIDFVQNLYATAIELNQPDGIPEYPLIQVIESTLDLFRIPIYISSMRLITFFKQIPEFQKLNIDEQIYIVKLNTLTVAFLHSLYIYNENEQVYHEPNTTDPLYLGNHWTNTIDKNFHEQMKQIQQNLSDLIQTDGRIIKIFFLIMLFSNYSLLTHSPKNVKSVAIFKAQNTYIELFYKYLLCHYGYHKAPTLLLRHINSMMKLQNLIAEFRCNAKDYMDVTKINPIMQSLL